MTKQGLASRKPTTSRLQHATLRLMAERYKVELGRAIARRRNELGLTQKQLADATHYKEAQTISRWERGETSPSNLDAVAAALDWTLAEMVAGIEPPNRTVARQWGLVPPEAENHTGDLMAALKPDSPDLENVSAKLDGIQETVEALTEAVREVLAWLVRASAGAAGAGEGERPPGELGRDLSSDLPTSESRRQARNRAGEGKPRDDVG